MRQDWQMGFKIQGHETGVLTESRLPLGRSEKPAGW